MKVRLDKHQTEDRYRRVRMHVVRDPATKKPRSHRSANTAINLMGDEAEETEKLACPRRPALPTARCNAVKVMRRHASARE
jgi:hypothetical protein